MKSISLFFVCLASANAFSVGSQSTRVSTALNVAEIDSISPEMVNSVTDAVKTVTSSEGGAAAAVPPNVAAAGAAALAAVAGLAASMSGKTEKKEKEPYFAEPEPEPINVSIPYDAAARLAFESLEKDEALFSEFKTLYEEQAVALVTSKKMERDLAATKKNAEALAAKMETL